MKTPKLQLLADQKTFDVVVSAGRWVILDSNVPAQNDEIVGQRITKSLIDSPNRWSRDYGVGLWSYIGKKLFVNAILTRIAALVRWHRENSQWTGNVTIVDIGASISGENVLLAVRTSAGKMAKYSVKGAIQ